MTDARMERIINQLADFDENELDFIVEKIYLERQEKRKTKINKLIENFRKAWEELTKEGVGIYYSDEEFCEEHSLDFCCFEFHP